LSEPLRLSHSLQKQTRPKDTESQRSFGAGRMLDGIRHDPENGEALKAAGLSE
jgi:hypothetical protein